MYESDANMSRLKQLSLRYLRKYGRNGSIFLVTALSVVVSVVVSIASVSTFSTDWMDDVVVIVGTAVFVPSCIAPVVTAAFASLLLELDQAHERVVKMSVTDSLTGCLNRRGFFDSVEKLLFTVSAPVEETMIGMIDMDNFKYINDNHGHAVGDEVLIKLSSLLSGILANKGVVGRLGGDEYALVAFGERAELNALKVDIQLLIGDFSFSETDRASASLGCTFLQDNETLDEALIRADEDLYKVKSQRKLEYYKTA